MPGINSTPEQKYLRTRFGIVGPLNLALDGTVTPSIEISRADPMYDDDVDYWSAGFSVAAVAAQNAVVALGINDLVVGRSRLCLDRLTISNANAAAANFSLRWQSGLIGLGAQAQLSNSREAVNQGVSNVIFSATNIAGTTGLLAAIWNIAPGGVLDLPGLNFVIQAYPGYTNNALGCWGEAVNTSLTVTMYGRSIVLAK